MDERIQETEVQEYLFEDDGRIPNNPTLPLLVYSQALAKPDLDPSRCKELLAENGGAAPGWTASSPIITTTRTPTRCFAW